MDNASARSEVLSCLLQGSSRRFRRIADVKRYVGYSSEEAFASIARLRAKVAANPAARNPEPAFSAVIVGAGEYARYDRDADVYVIPLTAPGV